MSKILICDSNLEFNQAVGEIAGALPGAEARYVQSFDLVENAIRTDQPLVLVTGPNVPCDDVLEFCRSQQTIAGRPGVVMVAEDVDTDLLRRALRAGIDDVVHISATETELQTSLLEALEEAESRAADSVVAGQVVPLDIAKSKAHVVTVFSTKGGVGKTVVSTNLAVALAGMQRSVVLVDLDLQFGDVGVMLGLKPEHTIADVVMASDRLDPDLLAGFLTDHPSGLKVLLAPVQPEEAEAISASRISKILGLLSAMFEYVVVDTSASLDDAVLTALDASDFVLALAMMDIASLKNTRISLQKLKQLGYNGTLVNVMLNRADSKVFLRIDEVEQAIGSPVRFRLPSDQIVPRSVNKGQPVVLEAPKSQPGRMLLAAAKQIMDEREEAVQDVAS